MRPRSPIERRFGFGAARVALCPPGAPRDRDTPPLLMGLRTAQAEAAAGTPLRAAIRMSPPLLAGVLLSLLLATLTQPYEQTEIVPFEPVAQLATEREPPIEVAEAPPARPDPPPTPAPVQPTPPEPVIAKARAPRTPPAPDPARATKPSLPNLALTEPTAPPPPTRTRRAVPTRSAHASLPRPALAPERVADNEFAPTPRTARSAPRFDRARPPSPRPPLAAAAPVPAAPAPAPKRPQRSARPSPQASNRSRPATPALAAPGVPAVAAEPPTTQPRRSTRAAPEGPPSRAPRPTLSGPLAPSAAESRRPATSSARAARPDAPSAPSSAQPGEARGVISGVPLASLAACVSDSKEQRLKQRIVAAAGKRHSCRSAVGRYHFLETKNVNAFLMRIERASGRRVGDRCAELTHALDCLTR